MLLRLYIHIGVQFEMFKSWGL